MSLILAGGRELVTAYATGELSPVDVTAAVLDVIDRLDGTYRAFVLVDHERAMAQARRSEARWRSGTPLGPGDGVPTSVKDVFLTAGWPTLRGSDLICSDGPWLEDAPVVARLRETGAVLIGKTATPEFGWKAVTDSPRHGPTGNPWDPRRTAGGSSGGSATAVALGMGAWSVGTDGGGSVRIPAAMTGTVAFKPTYGLIPMYPASPFGTLAHAGPMTRTVEDAAALLDVLVGFDERDWSAGPRPAGSFVDALDDALDDALAGLRIGFCPDLGHVTNDPEVAALVRRAADLLSDLGARVAEVDPGLPDPVEAFHVLWFAGAAKIVEPYGPAARELLDPGLRAAVEQGSRITASEYLDATAVRIALGVRMGTFHRDHDLLVTPTLPLTAFPLGADTPPDWPSPHWTSWTPYTYPFNLTQQPALSVPCGFTRSGLPAGLQIVGARHADATVLRAGRAYERAARAVRSFDQTSRE